MITYINCPLYPKLYKWVVTFSWNYSKKEIPIIYVQKVGISELGSSKKEGFTPFYNFFYNDCNWWWESYLLFLLIFIEWMNIIKGINLDSLSKKQKLNYLCTFIECYFYIIRISKNTSFCWPNDSFS